MWTETTDIATVLETVLGKDNIIAHNWGEVGFDITGAIETALSEMRQLRVARKRAVEALEEIDNYNGLHNDLDAYLSDVAEWGLGEREERPIAESFGLRLEAVYTPAAAGRADTADAADAADTGADTK